MEMRYTSFQTARGSRPDGRQGSTLYLVKNVGLMRLTYQVRLLTWMAREQQGSLVIEVPRSAEISRDLKEFVRENRRSVRISRFD